MELYARFGRRVRILRERCKISQADFARKLDMRPPTMHRLETGKQGADLWQATQIADALGVGVDELIGGEDGQ